MTVQMKIVQLLGSTKTGLSNFDSKGEAHSSHPAMKDTESHQEYNFLKFVIECEQDSRCQFPGHRYKTG